MPSNTLDIQGVDLGGGRIGINGDTNRERSVSMVADEARGEAINVGQCSSVGWELSHSVANIDIVRVVGGDKGDDGREALGQVSNGLSDDIATVS